VGGIEHAILHLLYSRFYNKLMRDVGLIKNDEPFSNLLTQGMVLKDGSKMSKSKGNTVDPQQLIERYGADTARLFIMFAAPPEQSLEWSDTAVEGAFRFLRRIWRAVYEHVQQGPVPTLDVASLNDRQKTLRRQLHETIKKISDDVGRRFTFNTAIAAVMELMNAIGKFEDRSEQSRAILQEAFEAILLMLSPIVPHFSHGLWLELCPGRDAIVDQSWPAADDAAMQRDQIQMVVQVNGKLRGQVEVPADADRNEVEKVALENENVKRFVEGMAIVKVIVVPGKLVNIVVK
jgi:leucyl-tRNA synthetase